MSDAALPQARYASLATQFCQMHQDVSAIGRELAEKYPAHEDLAGDVTALQQVLELTLAKLVEEGLYYFPRMSFSGVVVQALQSQAQ